jgi:hypothetical protein
MCLHSITKIYSETEQTDEVHFGLKIVKPNVWKNEFSSFGNRGEPFDKWLLRKEKILRAEDVFDSTYPSGFHIFTNREDAENYKNQRIFPDMWEVVRVQYRKILVEGTQKVMDGEANCVVAAEMFVEKPV